MYETSTIDHRPQALLVPRDIGISLYVDGTEHQGGTQYIMHHNFPTVLCVGLYKGATTPIIAATRITKFVCVPGEMDSESESEMEPCPE